MVHTRQHHWVPQLRQLSKKVIRNCYSYKKFCTFVFHHPPVSPLLTEQTVRSVPLKVLSVNYAGPIAYRSSKKRIGKVYILVFACSLTRAIYLELLPGQTADNCIRSFKLLTARTRRPRKIYSNNGKTFITTAKK